jgi:membrane protein implicated in regulation of membrane protease activity
MLEQFGTDAQIARFLIERGLGALYLIAFVVAALQFPALAGERGLEPATRVLRTSRFLDGPSIFHWVGYSDAKLRVLAWGGALLSALVVIGLPQLASLPITMLAWFALWAAYTSIVSLGGSFYSFGWETLLLEAGFLAIFLGNAEVAPPLLVMLAFRWLAFRVEFGAGLIKLRGDPCWRELTCMDYHHETQPMPNPLSWYFHHLPKPLHRLETIGNFAAQLVLPFSLFLPQPISSVGAALMIATQLYLVVSGNYAWLNWVTIVVLFAGISDGVLASLGIAAPAPLPDPPAWFTVAVVGLAVLVIVLSYRPVRNLLSPNQAMNASFDPFRLVNTYGAFGSVTRTRYEVIVEGTSSEAPSEGDWVEYEFKGKPGDPRRRPPQLAPYHLRLDWLMWFIPISPMYGEGWFGPLLQRLLENDPATLALLRTNPFADAPPRHVRARLFEYRFTTWHERRETGAWWHREPAGELVGPVRLPDRREPRGAASAVSLAAES